MKRLVQITILVLIPQIIIAILIYSYQNIGKYSNLEELRVEYSEKSRTIIDHSRFEELQQDFESPQEITAACLTCHYERGEEMLNNHHFTWERPEYFPGRGVVYTGKKTAMNNWCTSVLTSEQTCNRCHAGFGWDTYSFEYDYNDARNIDCLVCHDNSFNYSRVRGNAEHPDFFAEYDDFDLILKNLSSPQKENCGICHFLGGGGNNVKHGDLELALLWADKDMDVHMAREGADLSCVDCHVTENHQVRGRYYGIATTNTNRAHCMDCHGDFPHRDNLINEHCIKVSCQACHIPVYAKENATVMHWDWRTMGKLKDGEPYEIKDEDGNITYQSIKGTFEWGNMLEPDYVWFNGTANQHLMTDEITEIPIKMNTLYGEYRDRNSKIVPVKINTGYQLYDPVHNTLLHMKVYDHEEGQGAFWKDFDTKAAIEKGMEYIGMPISGEYDYIETKNYMMVNHMVSPKDQALSCTDCHTRNNGRLDNLRDFYMPGRDYNIWITGFGKGIVILSLIGVIVHGLIRIISNLRKKE